MPSSTVVPADQVAEESHVDSGYLIHVSVDIVPLQFLAYSATSLHSGIDRISQHIPSLCVVRGKMINFNLVSLLNP